MLCLWGEDSVRESCHLSGNLLGPRLWDSSSFLSPVVKYWGGCLKVSLTISTKVSEVCGVLLFDMCYVLFLGLCSNPGEANVKFLCGAML